MKFAITMSVFMALFAVNAKAENVCLYTLDQDEYWDNSNGDLTMNNEEFRCERVYLAPYEYTTLCNELGGEKATTKNFKWALALDGGEAQFYVFRSYKPNAKPVCSGVATVRQPEPGEEIPGIVPATPVDEKEE